MKFMDKRGETKPLFWVIGAVILLYLTGAINIGGSTPAAPVATTPVSTPTSPVVTTVATVGGSTITVNDVDAIDGGTNPGAAHMYRLKDATTGNWGGWTAIADAASFSSDPDADYEIWANEGSRASYGSALLAGKVPAKNNPTISAAIYNTGTAPTLTIVNSDGRTTNTNGGTSGSAGNQTVGTNGDFTFFVELTGVAKECFGLPPRDGGLNIPGKGASIPTKIERASGYPQDAGLIMVIDYNSVNYTGITQVVGPSGTKTGATVPSSLTGKANAGRYAAALPADCTTEITRYSISVDVAPTANPTNGVAGTCSDMGNVGGDGNAINVTIYPLSAYLELDGDLLAGTHNETNTRLGPVPASGILCIA